MAELTTRQRDKHTRGEFAYIDREGGEDLPTHDASHVKKCARSVQSDGFRQQSGQDAGQEEDPGGGA